MAKITLRKRRRAVRESSGKYDESSESDGGSSSEEAEGRHWKSRRPTRDDAKGKGKELMSEEDDYYDEDESNESDEENEEKKERAGVDQMGVKQALEEPTSICGICLTEGENERGKLDCCEHYFCFACIMEWSKVESKCPMCKQRFSTVMRPAISGVSRSRMRCIRIPTRDQVYEPSEEEIQLFTDPYQNTVCTQCQEAGDEGLLLLCDQCDAAAHTYCVGLGRSVPRGDWFCDACVLLSETSEEEEYEEETALETCECGEEDGSDTEKMLALMVANVDPGLMRRRSSRSAAARVAAVPLRRSNRRRRRRSGIFNTRASGRMSARYRRAHFPPLPEPYAARTLSQQRQVQATVQNRLQNLRDNWSRFQSGELQFTSASNSVASSRPASEAGDIPSSSVPGPGSSAVETTRNVDRAAEALPPSQRTRSSSGVAADTGDINKAWANMDLAFRLGGSTSGTSRSDSQEISTATRARTRERLLHTDVNLRTVNFAEGQVQGGATHSGAARSNCHDKGDYRTSHAGELLDFFGSHGSSSRDHDFRRSSRLDMAKRGDKLIEDDHPGILGSVSDNSRSGYNLRENSRQISTRAGNNARDNFSLTFQSSTSRESRSNMETVRGHSLTDDRDNSRGSGGSGCMTRRDTRDGQSLLVSPGSILDQDNSRGSAGVTTRRRDVKNSPSLRIAAALDDKDSSRGSTGPVTRRETSQNRSQALTQGKEQLSLCNTDKDEVVKVMKEQCCNFVQAALKPMLGKGTIDKTQFKDFARSATHTILSSLGVPGLKYVSNVVSMGTVTCFHEEPTSSSLIPGCCNACVQRHVKKFVKNLVQQKLNLHRSQM